MHFCQCHFLMHFFKTRHHFSRVCIPKGNHTDFVLAAAAKFYMNTVQECTVPPCIWTGSEQLLLQEFLLQQPTGYRSSEVYGPCLKRSIWPSYICAYIFTTGAQLLCGIKIPSPYIVPTLNIHILWNYVSAFLLLWMFWVCSAAASRDRGLGEGIPTFKIGMVLITYYYYRIY